MNITGRAARRSNSARQVAAGLAAPADHPFGISSQASATNNKGSRNDRRRYMARALRIAAKGI